MICPSIHLTFQMDECQNSHRYVYWELDFQNRSTKVETDAHEPREQKWAKNASRSSSISF